VVTQVVEQPDHVGGAAGFAFVIRVVAAYEDVTLSLIDVLEADGLTVQVS
jgi:hypothetical protein